MALANRTAAILTFFDLGHHPFSRVPASRRAADNTALLVRQKACRNIFIFYSNSLRVRSQNRYKIFRHPEFPALRAIPARNRLIGSYQPPLVMIDNGPLAGSD